MISSSSGKTGDARLGGDPDADEEDTEPVRVTTGAGGVRRDDGGIEATVDGKELVTDRLPPALKFKLLLLLLIILVALLALRRWFL
jgi:hypothetical protein